MKTLNSLFFIGIVFLTFFFVACDKDAPVLMEEENVQEVDTTGGGVFAPDTTGRPEPIVNKGPAEIFFDKLAQNNSKFDAEIMLYGLKGYQALFSYSGGSSSWYNCAHENSLIMDGATTGATQAELALYSSRELACNPDVTSYFITMTLMDKNTVEIIGFTSGNAHDWKYLNYIKKELVISHKILRGASVFTMIPIGPQDQDRPTKIVLRE